MGEAMRNHGLIAAVLIACMIALGCGGAEKPPVEVVMETSLGDITLELYPAQAPRTVENFLAYAAEGFYDSTIFHRVIPRFMIQGGGYDGRLREKPTRDPIPNESGNGLLNERGSIAMARLNDPDSATSQFYLNLVNHRHLDEAGYAVFGKVTAGMEVVDAIAALETRDIGRGFANLPYETVVIRGMRVE